MIKKCIGCGVRLQNCIKDEKGYIKNLDKEMCERCFRIQHYNEYKIIEADNDEFLNILKDVNKTKDLVLLLIDIFNIPSNLELIKQYINNDIILIITKYDLLKPYLNEDKLINYINQLSFNNVFTLVISSEKNYNLDLLFNMINKYKKSSNVYVIGNTNVGKSTMINKIIYNYTNFKSNITTSQLPSTTLNNLEIKINDNLTLIDTPGILDQYNIINYVKTDEIHKIVPKTTVNPKTYQIKVPQTIKIDDYAYIYFQEVNDVTIYASNRLTISRVYKNINANNFKKHVINIPSNHDLIINGLCFMKVKKGTKLIIYTLKDVSVYVRKSLI